MPNSDFEPLTHVLEDWFACSFDEIPEAVRQQIASDLWPIWDELSEPQRRDAAVQWDAMHDPAYEQERERTWSLWCELDAVRRETGEWDALRPQSITEKAEQANQLHALRERERQLLDELNSPGPPPAASEPRVRRRDDNLKRAIFDAWKRGFPVDSSASELFDHLATKDDTGYIRGRDGDELIRENSSGGTSRTTLKSLSNRLPAYRKEFSSGE
ncbi:MAG: hypothetical protein KGM49_14085 [Sphingomonadales bacterium]|nr:hypothetical protein [Sphingomonadales bacterium]